MIEIYKKNGRLTKISDNDNSLRSNQIVGYFHAPPMVDYNFVLFSEPLTTGMEIRTIMTSIVVNVSKEHDQYIFKTSNSVYMLEIFEECSVGRLLLNE